LVLSEDAFNRSSGVCIGVPVTSAEKPQFGAFRPKIPKGEANLAMDSWAQSDQILTISTTRLIARKGRVGARVLSEVLDGLKVLLKILP
jgi:mRNA-degrading endonuclease toxin of MazEF toxin-antitoxin module